MNRRMFIANAVVSAPILSFSLTLWATTSPDNPRNWRIGRISHVLYPGYSWCYRCLTTWNLVQRHCTTYDHGAGCFPLCELCWKELGTPTARLPYYHQMFNEWKKFGKFDETKWNLIRTAVLEGK